MCVAGGELHMSCYALGLSSDQGVAYMRRKGLPLLGCFKLLVVVLVTGGCVAPVQHKTASGKPEVTISTNDVGVVKAALVSEMIDRGYGITTEGDYRLVFDRPVDNLLVGVLLGSSYDSTPNARISYTLVPTSGRVRVVADIAIITNPGSAFERRTEMNQHQDSLDVQKALDALKSAVDAQRPLGVVHQASRQPESGRR